MKNNKFAQKDLSRGFGLPEVLAAVAILAILSSSVLVVINRCMTAAADSELKLKAFEVARENMEMLLTLDTVSEGVEYGNSEIYPDIEWTRVVETFYEPMTNRVWVLGTCSADYIDASGEDQSVELTCWLTDLSKTDLMNLIEERKEQEALDANSPDFDPNSPVDSNVPTDSNKPVDSNAPKENKVLEANKPVKSDKQFDWLPDDWNQMTPSQQWDWLVDNMWNK